MTTFASPWKPWTWCRHRRAGCRLTRHHHGRRGYPVGFDVHYFDTTREGTP